MKFKVSIELILFFLFSIVYSQQREELEIKKNKNLDEIKLTNELLDKTKSEKKFSINRLQILNRKIRLRKDLIDNINKEIIDLNAKINELNEEILKTEYDINFIKKEYSKAIYNAYIHRNFQNRLMFVLASENIGQAYEKIKYFNEYFDYIKKQVIKLKDKENDLIKKKDDLNKILLEREGLVTRKKDETNEMLNDKENQKKIFEGLKSKEKELLKKLKEKEKIKAEIEKEIKKIIEEESRKAINSKSNLYEKLTPDERLISNDFKKNKGKLPWPTSKGIITGFFGEQDHPVLKGIKIKNNGIDITTVNDAEVRSIFEGVVSKVIVIKGANYAVIIRHGNYLSVYQNLIDVCVKAGEQIKTKQKIGLVYSSEEENSVIHLEIWEELNKLDPVNWLSK